MENNIQNSSSPKDNGAPSGITFLSFYYEGKAMESKYWYEKGALWILYREDSLLETSNELLSILPETLQSRSVTTVILDLNFIDMMNSVGVSTLLRFYDIVDQARLKFIVLANPYVSNILKVVGLQHIIHTVDSREEAISLLSVSTETATAEQTE